METSATTKAELTSLIHRYQRGAEAFSKSPSADFRTKSLVQMIESKFGHDWEFADCMYAECAATIVSSFLAHPGLSSATARIADEGEQDYSISDWCEEPSVTTAIISDIWNKALHKALAFAFTDDFHRHPVGCEE